VLFLSETVYTVLATDVMNVLQVQPTVLPVAQVVPAVDEVAIVDDPTLERKDDMDRIIYCNLDDDGFFKCPNKPCTRR
jgi:hypothetical protein